MRRFLILPLAVALPSSQTVFRGVSSLSSSSSSSSSSSTRRRPRRTVALDGAYDDAAAAELYPIEDESTTPTRHLSAAERLAQRDETILPWESRPAAVSYRVSATDWKFLDRALSALVEMGSAEVSERSLRLSGRDLLKDVAHPVVALRRTSLAAKRSASSASATRRRKHDAKQDVTVTPVEATAVTPETAESAANSSPSVSVANARKRRAAVVTPQAQGAETDGVASTTSATEPAMGAPSTTKPRRRSKRTTVRL